MSQATVAEGGTGQGRSTGLTFVSAVTGLYAIMAFVSGGIVILLRDVAGDYLIPGLGDAMVVIALVAFLLGGFFAAVAYGVWNRNRRSRSLGFAVHALPVVGSIPLLAVGNIWVLPSLVLSGAAVYVLYEESTAFK